MKNNILLASWITEIHGKKHHLMVEFAPKSESLRECQRGSENPFETYSSNELVFAFCSNFILLSVLLNKHGTEVGNTQMVEL